MLRMMPGHYKHHVNVASMMRVLDFSVNGHAWLGFSIHSESFT